MVGVMQILAIVAAIEAIPKHDPERNKLEYVEMKVGQGALVVVLDIDVTHSFMREEVARIFGLKFIQT